MDKKDIKKAVQTGISLSWLIIKLLHVLRNSSRTEKEIEAVKKMAKE